MLKTAEVRGCTMLRRGSIAGYKGGRIAKSKVRWEGIVKAQRPIVSTVGYNSCLFYNEGKSIFQIIELSENEMDKVFGDELKVYLKVVLYKNGELSILERVDEQDW